MIRSDIYNSYWTDFVYWELLNEKFITLRGFYRLILGDESMYKFVINEYKLFNNLGLIGMLKYAIMT